MGRGTIGTLTYDNDRALERALTRISRQNRNNNAKKDDQLFSGDGKRGPPWSREEDILALALYRASGSAHDDLDPEVQEIAHPLQRSPSAVVFKLGNFKAVETRGKAGFTHFAPMDQKVWQEFAGRDGVLYDEADKIRTEIYSRYKERDTEEIEDLAKRLSNDGLLPTGRISQVLTRQKTTALRRAVLANYRNECAFCDVDIPELLTTAHIHRWTEDENNRYNLRNVLCLCILHHAAFDDGLLTVSPDGKIIASPSLRRSLSSVIRSQLRDLNGKLIRRPAKYDPDPDFLKGHGMTRFKK